MKKIRKLTLEEQKYAETHHNLVYRFLSYHGLKEKDYYDVVIFGFLLAVQEYLEKPELQKYQFSTIAWKAMKDALAKECLYHNRAKRTAPVVPYAEEDSLSSLNAFLPLRTEKLEEQLLDREILTDLLSCLTPKEREVIFLKADGYTHQEIAEHCRISVYGVQSRITRLRRRLLTIRVMPNRRNTA